MKKSSKVKGLLMTMVLLLFSSQSIWAASTQVADYQNMSEEERVAVIGKVCKEDYQKSGVLASVSAAQCILESGYMTTDLAVNANNCFGMKAVLSGNTWADSLWDGVSIYTKNTHEEYDGEDVVITADFRMYSSLEDSVADHSAYLLGATDDFGYRYAGLKGEKDYKTAITIIKNGGYATDSSYVDKICNIIERFNLTQYDVVDNSGTTSTIQFVQEKEKTNENTEDEIQSLIPKAVSQQGVVYHDSYYRVRLTWGDKSSQVGAFVNLENAKKACIKGYSVYDSSGKVLYTA